MNWIKWVHSPHIVTAEYSFLLKEFKFLNLLSLIYLCLPAKIHSLSPHVFHLLSLFLFVYQSSYMMGLPFLTSSWAVTFLLTYPTGNAVKSLKLECWSGRWLQQLFHLLLDLCQGWCYQEFWYVMNYLQYIDLAIIVF